MSSIKLKNIRIFANHGCMTEEEKIGSDYLVNLTVKANLSRAAQSDKLSETVDYVHLNKIVKDELEGYNQNIMYGLIISVNNFKR